MSIHCVWLRHHSVTKYFILLLITLLFQQFTGAAGLWFHYMVIYYICLLLLQHGISGILVTTYTACEISLIQVKSLS